MSKTSSDAKTRKFSSDVMWINNARLWSTYRASCFYFLFFSNLPVSFLHLFSPCSYCDVESGCISRCSRYDVQIFQWMNGLLSTKGNRRIFLWEWSTSPLIARLSLSRSCSLLSSLARLPSVVRGTLGGFQCCCFVQEKLLFFFLLTFFCRIKNKKSASSDRFRSFVCRFIAIDMKKREIKHPKWLKDWLGLVSECAFAAQSLPSVFWRLFWAQVSFHQLSQRGLCQTKHI